MENNESKIVHFLDDFTLLEINDYLKKNSNILYYTRTLKNNTELHIIKFQNNAFFKLSTLISELLKMYSKNKNVNDLIKEIKLKGNDNFVIIENINIKLINLIKNDLNKLLIK